jgi:hypothetical protein
MPYLIQSKNIQMLTLEEIYKFVSETERSILKDYYDKCYDTLKEINRRSNLLSVFILLLTAIYFFSTSIKDSTISGFKVNLDIIEILSPLLIPYFILEWCLIARRRRELMRVMKFAGFKIFNTPMLNENISPFILSIHSRNTIPFSFMMELLNIDTKSRVNSYSNLYFIRTMLAAMAIYLIYLCYISFRQPHLTIPVLICNILGAFCTFRIALFYRSEFKSIKQVNMSDKVFIENKDWEKFDLSNA